MPVKTTHLLNRRQVEIATFVEFRKDLRISLKIAGGSPTPIERPIGRTEEILYVSETEKSVSLLLQNGRNSKESAAESEHSVSKNLCAWVTHRSLISFFFSRFPTFSNTMEVSLT